MRMCGVMATKYSSSFFRFAIHVPRRYTKFLESPSQCSVPFLSSADDPGRGKRVDPGEADEPACLAQRQGRSGDARGPVEIKLA